MDEITGGKGITFATGTPVSNSMTELYTIQRYLQYDRLQEMNLGMFDSWASIFGETVTAMELSPEGNGYRMKTRFANFFNLPELMSVFQEVADIQTSDMLQLPVPEAEYENGLWDINFEIYRYIMGQENIHSIKGSFYVETINETYYWLKYKKSLDFKFDSFSRFMLCDFE